MVASGNRSLRDCEITLRANTTSSGRGFHDRAASVNIFFAFFADVTDTVDRRPTGGAVHSHHRFHNRKGFWSAFDNTDRRPTGGTSPTAFCFFTNRRYALLPFALLLELSAPVPVGVLHLKRGCHLCAELIRSPSLAGSRSAATSQSPELGDSLQTHFD